MLQLFKKVLLTLRQRRADRYTASQHGGTDTDTDTATL